MLDRCAAVPVEGHRQSVQKHNMHECGCGFNALAPLALVCQGMVNTLHLLIGHAGFVVQTI